MEQKIIEWTDQSRDTLCRLSREIHSHPELSGREYRAAKLHAGLLEECGFQVRLPFLGLETAFQATYDSGVPGPCIAYLAEYDALPRIGHGCGHNLLGAVSTVAGIVLSKALGQTGGSVVVLGCPAEETNGAKVRMAGEGVFERIDAAMLAHPYYRFQASGSSAALQAIRFAFFGKEAHAADAPGAGVNALRGVLELFRYIDALRPGLPPRTSINGVIPHGGTVANVIPDYACGDFHLRGPDSAALEKLADKLGMEAERIAAGLGARLKISHYETAYENMVTNQALSRTFSACLRRAGVEQEAPPEESPFSLDMGNVSHVCPSIHPYFGICDGEKAELHTEQFCAYAASDYAERQALAAAKALALTGLEVLTRRDLLAEIKKEFQTYQSEG